MLVRKIAQFRQTGTLWRCSCCFYSKTPVVRSQVAASHSPGDEQAQGGVVDRADGPLKTVKKPGSNFPIVKNMFIGQFDKEFLAYPELSSNEELDDLNQLVAPVEKFFKEAVDSKAIDVNAKIPEETMQQLKEFGLFGQQIPVEYGGLGLNATGYAKLCEATAHDPSIAVTLGAHQSIGLKGILIAGNEEQKRKYLPKLATGEQIAAFCLTEASSGSDAASIQSKAVLSDDGKHFILNGTKIWISNGGIADVFTVFAKTPAKDSVGNPTEKVTAFIVERAFPGVTSGRSEDKLGIRGSNTAEVNFDNTPVPVENVLGEVGGGFKVAMNILNSGRFSMGSSSASGMRTLIGLAAEHAISRTQFGKQLKEFEMIQEKFANMAITTYAMESMAYFTTGILDGYEEPDASLEAAIVKVFSSEGNWASINDGLQIMGGMGYMKDYPFERALRDSRILLIFEGTNEILRLLIALTGMQHAGEILNEYVRKLRDPFNNVGFVFKEGYKRMTAKPDDPKLTMRLHEHIHQNLESCADSLERSLIRFKYTVEKVLQRHGQDIINQQLVLKRIANIVIDMYAMTACVSRASRSLCIGLKNADHEVLLTQAFYNQAMKRINDNFEQIDVGTVMNGDEHLKKIAKTIFKNHGYAAEHPLTRNW